MLLIQNWSTLNSCIKGFNLKSQFHNSVCLLMKTKSGVCTLSDVLFLFMGCTSDLKAQTTANCRMNIPNPCESEKYGTEHTCESKHYLTVSCIMSPTTSFSSILSTMKPSEATTVAWEILELSYLEDLPPSPAWIRTSMMLGIRDVGYKDHDHWEGVTRKNTF